MKSHPADAVRVAAQARQRHVGTLQTNRRRRKRTSSAPRALDKQEQPGFVQDGAERRRRRRRGATEHGGDVQLMLRLTLREAALGTQREVIVRALRRCLECDGVGARPGSRVTCCAVCRGEGQVARFAGGCSGVSWLRANHSSMHTLICFCPAVCMKSAGIGRLQPCKWRLIPWAQLQPWQLSPILVLICSSTQRRPLCCGRRRCGGVSGVRRLGRAPRGVLPRVWRRRTGAAGCPPHGQRPGRRVLASAWQRTLSIEAASGYRSSPSGISLSGLTSPEQK